MSSEVRARALPVEAAVREVLGAHPPRPGQLESVAPLVAGRDVVAVLPTGLGKSAVYEIAGLCRPGPTVVVSPLLALQRDQLEHLEADGIGDAAAVNSTVDEKTFAETLDRFVSGQIEFLFLSPEQLAKPEVLERVATAAVSLVVVDEAHCISTWGHDFRPAYLALGDAIDALAHPPVLALTATAPPPVRDDIAAGLHLRDPAFVVGDLDRPNISFAVQRVVDVGEKQRALVEYVANADPPGIVYVATRRHVDEVTAQLHEAGVAAVGYHAGMRRRERDAAQTEFMEGRAPVIVATNAFGMGIDKPDVRFVVHFDPPESLDAYFQEAGRAGRDGEPADALLLFRPEDLGLRRFFAGRTTEQRTELERSRVEMLRAYAERRACRREFLLTYFGEEERGPCGRCDVCRRAETGERPERPVDEARVRPYAPGEKISHRTFGIGDVVGYDRDLMIVRFEDGGYKTLAADAVVRNDLVERA